MSSLSLIASGSFLTKITTHEIKFGNFSRVDTELRTGGDNQSEQTDGGGGVPLLFCLNQLRLCKQAQSSIYSTSWVSGAKASHAWVCNQSTVHCRGMWIIAVLQQSLSKKKPQENLVLLLPVSIVWYVVF